MSNGRMDTYLSMWDLALLEDSGQSRDCSDSGHENSYIRVEKMLRYRCSLVPTNIFG